MSQRDYVEKDYYATLGLSKEAEAAEISKAYRKLARELHPDARPNDPEAEARFKEVSEAYAVLSNPEKRREYDRVRQLVGSGGFAGFPGGGDPFGGGGTTFGGGAGQPFDISDLLGGLFGQAGGDSPFRTAGRRAGRRKGRDVEADLTLSFEEAMAGVTTTLRVGDLARCSTCGGSGARPGTSPITCPVCNGAGTVARDQGLFSFSEPCDACGGRGRQIPDPCPTCSGTGQERRGREIRARIPAGVRDGARIRLKGKGEQGGAGTTPGDLYVTVHVASHELFERRGDNIVLHAPVTFTEAALGTKITVPTLDKPVTLKIPAGTESGRTFRIKGRGAPRSGGGKGDLLVVVDVAVPRKLTRTQKKLLEQYAATENGDVRAHLDRLIGQGV